MQYSKIGDGVNTSSAKLSLGLQIVRLYHAICHFRDGLRVERKPIAARGSFWQLNIRVISSKVERSFGELKLATYVETQELVASKFLGFNAS